MSKRIFRSTFLACIIVMAACLVVILGSLYSYFGNIQEQQLEEELTVAAAGVEESGEQYLTEIAGTQSRITWIAADGEVIYDSDADSSTMENHSDREEVQEALAEGEGTSSRWSATLIEREIYYAKRLSDGTVLRVSAKRMTPQAIIVNMMQPIMIVIVVALILAAVLAKGLSARIAKPLNNLNLEDPLNNESYEELKPLLDRLAHQQVEINEQMNDLNSVAEMRKEFTANVSHELKTPLQSIMGSAEILENGLVKEEDKPEFIGRIRKESSRLLTLIDDIVRLSKLDGQVDIKREEINLLESAGEVCAMIKDVAAKSGVSLYVHGEDVRITSVRPLITEIIFNLVDNAIKYNKEGGSVEVRVFGKSDAHGSGGEMHRAKLTVSDTGIGIAPEDQAKIFERFYRVDKSHSSAIGGTGLGLSIVKHALEQIGASIEVESEVGKGTTMTVLF